jgi:hypothetical protein
VFKRLNGSKVLPVALSATLAIGLLGTAPAKANDNLLTPSTNLEVTLIERGGDSGVSTEVILLEPFRGGGRSWTACKQWGEAPCDPATISRTKSNMLGFLLMPACKNGVSEHCLSGLSIYKAGEEPVAAEYLGEVPAEVFPAMRGTNFPEGRAQTLWRAPGLEHEGGTDTYSVEFIQEVKFENGKYFYNFFTVSVVPYVETADASSKAKTVTEYVDNRGRKAFRTNTYGSEGKNAWFADGVVGRIAKFAPDTRVLVSVRVPKVYGGWFKGRIARPDIRVKNYNARMNEITVDASVVEVPYVTAQLNESNWNPLITKVWPDGKRALDRGEGGGIATGTEGSFDWVEALRKPLSDTAPTVNTVWNFSTLQTWQRDWSGCTGDSNRVLGFVSTNAAVFDGTPPRFERGFLNYQVAGMHYLPDGTTKARGSYDLVMRSDVARCLYGLPKVPVSATVQVVNEKGNKTFATSVVGEKNGWLKLGAYNFTFSKKVIKVKVVRAKKVKKNRIG